MSEAWQLVAVGAAGVVMILPWIFFIYLPRRTGEGLGRHSTNDTREHRAENDDLS